jgi:hypothetical protein
MALDERPEIDLAEWLRSVGGGASAARFIREFGLVGSSDPAVEAVVKTQSALREGADGAVLAAVCGAPDLTKEGRRAWRRVDRAIEELQRRRDRARARGLRVPPSFWDREEGRQGDEGASASLAAIAIEEAIEADTVSDLESEPDLVSADCGAANIEMKGNGATATAMDGQVVADEPMTVVEASGPARWPIKELAEVFRNGIVRGERRAAVTRSMDSAPDEQIVPPSHPGGVVGRPNPFLQVPVRSSDLEWKEVMKVYEAMAFALDQGIWMSAHVVIVWSMFGVTEHERASKLTGKVLHEARKWAAVGKPSELRQRQRARSGDGFDLAWVYAHENDRRRGFHTHILMNVPTAMARVFERWLWSALRRLTNNPGVPPALWVRPAWERTEHDQIQRHWRWMTYIMKGLPPSVGMRYRGGASLGPAREVLQLFAYREDMMPVFCDHLVNVSRNIDKKAQKAAGFVSKLQMGPGMLDRLYDGSEWRAGEIREKFNAVAPTLHF